MKRRRITPTQIVGLLLFIIVVVLGVTSRQNADDSALVARCRFDDGAPLGGKGLRLLLQGLGYKTERVSQAQSAMPKPNAAWLLLDPQTRFSKREARQLLDWVQAGGTLIWADTSDSQRTSDDWTSAASPAVSSLRDTLKSTSIGRAPSRQLGQILPELVALGQASPSRYWDGVSKASASGEIVSIGRAHLPIAASKGGPQIARIEVGRGHVFVLPDALMFSNYALSKSSNAILATNLVRAHIAPGATVFFDERDHDSPTDIVASKPTLLYWLWRPPLRWAILQVGAALLLLWAFYGRRLGAPIPLPDPDPVTRASQFAIAMGALFQKAERPQTAALTLGENFRYRLARRLGLSAGDPDEMLLERAHSMTGLDRDRLDRLLLRSRAPSENEAAMLADAQEMEWVLQQLEGHQTM